MLGVKVKDNEPFESAVRRFKRTVEKSGILSDFRKNEFHETRSAKKKRAQAAAVKRFRKKQLRDSSRGERGADSSRGSSAGASRGPAGRAGAKKAGGSGFNRGGSSSNNNYHSDR